MGDFDWRDNYDVLHSVDPAEYMFEDDFISSRMSSRGDFNQGGGKEEGCYIATCVYGSYDCPEVLALRRFRDRTLKASAPGRAFIRCYYAISPRLVAVFGNMRWFHALCRRPLDWLVRRVGRDRI